MGLAYGFPLVDSLGRGDGLALVLIQGAALQ